MPWTSDDAQSHTSHADTPAKRRQWAAIANERLKAGDKEGAAIRQANAAVHKTENHYMHGETVEKVLKYLADVEPRLAEIMAKEVSETSVELTLPLLIRLLEYAKEDANADIDLHQIAERASQMAGVLDSDSYSKLVPQDKKNKVMKDMGVGDVHVPTALGNQGGSTKLSVSFLQALDGQKKAKKVPDAAPAKTIMEKQYPLRITKIDAEQQKIFGWASISARNNELIVDKQDDVILPEDLELGAHDFMLYSRSHGDMHQNDANGVPVQTGRLIESLVFTPEKLAKAGLSAIDLDNGDQLYGWFVGFKVDDPRVWDMHKRGHRPEFSIGGRGHRVEIAKATDQRMLQLIRHGKTALNNESASVDRIRGWSDIPLSPDGKQQALKLAEMMTLNPPDVLVTSDLRRAHDTAKIISAMTDVPISEVSEGFRPWNVGVYAGQVTNVAVPELANYVRNRPDEAVPEGESFNDFKMRFFDALKSVLDKYDGKIAIVTHHRGERLMAAWNKAGFPADGDINVDEFCQRGEDTGRVIEMVIDRPPYQMAAE